MYLMRCTNLKRRRWPRNGRRSDNNSYQCFGIASKISNLCIISDTETGADCLVGNYNNDAFVAFRGTEGLILKTGERT